MNSFFIALQFMTRLPVKRELDLAPESLGRSVLFYPLVGLVIGLCLIIVAGIGSIASAQVAAALVLIVWVLLTGALHLDGLADSADAWVGGYGDKDRTLAIMKDPYCGPAGVAAIVLVLLLKYAALVTLLEASEWAALIVAAVIGRSAIIFLFTNTPYVRVEGIGASHADYLPRGDAKWMLIWTGLFLIVLAGWKVLLVLLVTLALFYWLRHMMQQRLGGTTGDTAGAMVELLEVGSLITLVLIC